MCVADADKLHDQLDAIARPPPETADVAAWLAAAERAWEKHLRDLCAKAPPTSLHGRLLRWSKESLLLADFDREAARQRLGIDIESAALKDHLSRCAPVLASVNGAAFSDTFRRPLRCLTELDRAQRGGQGSNLTKASPEIDDALRDLARDDCAIIAERVPDIDRLADALWNLAAPPRASC